MRKYRLRAADQGFRNLKVVLAWPDGKKLIGYTVVIPEHTGSGRSYLSKGLLMQARACADVSMGIGDLVLFPAIKAEPETTINALL